MDALCVHMERKTHPHRTVGGIAEAQHGVLSRGQLLDAGIGVEGINARLRTGALVALHEGVYAVGHRALPVRARFMAAVMAGGAGTVVSHRSAAALWGLRPSRGAVEVTVPHGTGARRRAHGVEVHQTRTLPAWQVSLHDSIPVTTVARTLLDLAAIVPPHHLRRAVERAEQLELFDLRQVERVLATHPRRRGRRSLAAMLADAHRHDLPATRSDMEAAMLQICIDYGLPRPQVNRYANGREVDFRWPEQRLVVELDGWATHKTRKAFANDRARDRALVHQRWRVARFTWPDVMHRRHEVAAELRALLTA